MNTDQSLASPRLECVVCPPCGVSHRPGGRGCGIVVFGPHIRGQLATTYAPLCAACLDRRSDVLCEYSVLRAAFWSPSRGAEGARGSSGCLRAVRGGGSAP